MHVEFCDGNGIVVHPDFVNGTVGETLFRVHWLERSQDQRLDNVRFIARYRQRQRQLGAEFKDIDEGWSRYVELMEVYSTDRVCEVYEEELRRREISCGT